MSESESSKAQQATSISFSRIEKDDGLKCAICGSRDGLSFPDGDTVPLVSRMPELHAVAQGLALSNGKYSMASELLQCECRCGAASYIINLGLINQADVTEEWANKYFCLNEEITETAEQFMVTTNARGVPERWLMERIATAEGMLDCHTFGPFLPAHKLAGPYGVSCCSGDDGLWTRAADLISRVWPLLTGEPERPTAATRTHRTDPEPGQ